MADVENRCSDVVDSESDRERLYKKGSIDVDKLAA